MRLVDSVVASLFIITILLLPACGGGDSDDPGNADVPPAASDDPGNADVPPHHVSPALIKLDFPTALLESTARGFSPVVGFLGANGTVAASVSTGSGFQSPREAWIYDGQATYPAGLTDKPYFSARPAAKPNATGLVTGNSEENASLVPALFGGRSWLYQDGGTLPLGITDYLHRDLSGQYKSTSIALNDLGQVLGMSQRYDPVTGEPNGSSAWLYQDGTTSLLGLTDSEHLYGSSVGEHLASASNQLTLNQQGQAIGGSSRLKGASAWLYDRGAVFRLGFFDSPHTATDGTQISGALALNESGQVIGSSEQYGSGTSLRVGRSAWLASGAGSDPLSLGMLDENPGTADGSGYHYPHFINEQGQVVGLSSTEFPCSPGGPFYSDCYDDDIAWFYDGNATRRIGLYDVEHQRADGTHSHTVRAMNNQGQAIGESVHPISNPGGTGSGQSAWFYDGEESRRIGLPDQLALTAADYRSSSARFLNELGQVVGTTEILNPTPSFLYDRTISHTWFYDSESRRTFILEKPGATDLQVTHLSDTGVVLGYYTVAGAATDYTVPGAATDDASSRRAFYFSVEAGFLDLDQLIANAGLDLEASGFRHLAGARDINPTGQIFGYGQLLDGSIGSFLFSPGS
jgi:hypothetical protein